MTHVDQLRMFDPVPPQFARARRTDAVGSQDAAAAMERTGNAKINAQRILEAVRRWPGCTSRELAANAHIDRYECGRRLPELADEKVGLVRRVEFSTEASPTNNTTRCAVSEKRAIRWWPA